MKAVYHREANPPHELTVLGKNEDGTFNLGTDEGTLVVSGCAVTEEAKPGFCSLVETLETPKKKK